MLGQTTAAADVKDRALGAERGGDASYRVGAPGASGGDDTAELTGLARIAVGSVGCDLFVPDVDDADALVDAAIVNVDDVAATEREDRIDTLGLEGLSNEAATRDDVRIGALAGKCIVGRVGLDLLGSGRHRSVLC